jgi:proline iminopeptidase
VVSSFYSDPKYLAWVVGVLLSAANAAAEPVRAATRLEVNGAQLYLEVRGADRQAPVLLWLHGGPGGAERPLFRLYNGELERHFVVAYLDQRGTGRSFDPGADPAQLTIERHLDDLDHVVAHLRGTLEGSRVALVGHSWGGALALLYAEQHPQNVSAVVAVAPLIATQAAWASEYEFVREEARRRGDARVLQALNEVGPPPYRSAADVLAVERLADRYGAVFHQRPCRSCALARGLLRGLAWPWEIPRYIRGNEVSLDAMHDELAGLDLNERVPMLQVPVHFLLGRFDRHVDSDVAREYAEVLAAPEKAVIWFDHSAHNVPFEEPERFNAVVRKLVSDGFAGAVDGPG